MLDPASTRAGRADMVPIEIQSPNRRPAPKTTYGLPRRCRPGEHRKSPHSSPCLIPMFLSCIFVTRDERLTFAADGRQREHVDYEARMGGARGTRIGEIGQAMTSMTCVMEITTVVIQ